MKTPATQMRRLFWTLTAVFAVLGAAALVLISLTFSQLRYEALHNQRLLAEQWVGQLTRANLQRFEAEYTRQTNEYQHTYLAEDGRRLVSPLADPDRPSQVPGLVGYFQVDADGRFTTPLISAERTPAENPKAADQHEVLRELLSLAPTFSGVSDDDFITVASEAEDTGVVEGNLYEQLQRSPINTKKSLGRVEEFALESAPQPARLEQAVKEAESSLRQQKLRVEPDSASMPQAAEDLIAFDDGIDPFQFRPIGGEHFAFFRKVWANDQQLIQGLVVQRDAFIRDLFTQPFTESLLAADNQLFVALSGDIVAIANTSGGLIARGSATDSTPLLRARLPAPLNQFELYINKTNVPLGSSFWISLATAIVMLLTLAGAYFVLLWIGKRQVQLVSQQQDFVSAVSHELKTPLTSIRMYAEMLKAGWTDESKRATYYDYIFGESERLSRLIENVLQFARITRNAEPTAELRALEVEAFVREVEPKLANVCTAAGFELDLEINSPTAKQSISANADSLTQILMNLIDNAVKFSANAETKKIILRVDEQQERIRISVRDFGPGIDPGQRRRIFQLFYRGENELTRETLGTGLGLALVAELANQMQASIDVVNRDPGAEFRISFSIDS